MEKNITQYLIIMSQQGTRKPRSLPVKVGSSQFEMPTCLCLRPDRKTYCAGLEAEYFAREKGGFLAGNLYEISAQNGPVAVGGEKKRSMGASCTLSA